MKRPRNNTSARPYRIWDAVARRPLRWRCYGYARNALNGALIEARWAKVDSTLEVYDCRTGRLLGQFHRGATKITFSR